MRRDGGPRDQLTDCVAACGRCAMTCLLPAFTQPPQLDTVHHCDAMTLLKACGDSSISLIACDPPYFQVKDKTTSAWDWQWPTDAAYLDWLRVHLREMRRVLKPNGSLYLFASPRMAARVELAVGECFNVLNQVVWYKTTGNRNWSADKEAIRSFLPNTERIIFAEQSANSVAPLKNWFRDRVNEYDITLKQLNLVIGSVQNGGGMASHYFGDYVEFQLPTVDMYAKMQAAYPEAFNRHYIDLRREYEDLRRPFNGALYTNFTDVWNYTPVHSYPGKHECEKPLDLMRHIVSMSSRPGDTVLDCFAGSGATLDAARQEGRHYIGCDMSAHWVKFARNRLAQAYTVPMFASIESEAS